MLGWIVILSRDIRTQRKDSGRLILQLKILHHKGTSIKENVELMSMVSVISLQFILFFEYHDIKAVHTRQPSLIKICHVFIACVHAYLDHMATNWYVGGCEKVWKWLKIYMHSIEATKHESEMDWQIPDSPWNQNRLMNCRF